MQKEHLSPALLQSFLSVSSSFSSALRPESSFVCEWSNDTQYLPFNHIKCVTAVVLGTFALLRDHGHRPAPRLFDGPKLKLCSH